MVKVSTKANGQGGFGSGFMGSGSRVRVYPEVHVMQTINC